MVEANKETRRLFLAFQNEVRVTAGVLKESRALIAMADQIAGAWTDGGQALRLAEIPAQEKNEKPATVAYLPNDRRRRLQ